MMYDYPTDVNGCNAAVRKEGTGRRDGLIERCREGGGWVFVISLGLIPWEQMVNGGLPTEDALSPRT